MHGAMDGDTVLAREERTRARASARRSPAKAERISGTVVKVLVRARERVVGRFETQEGHKVVLPYDPKIDAVVRIAGRQGARRPRRRDRRSAPDLVSRRAPDRARRRRRADRVSRRAGRGHRDRAAVPRPAAAVPAAGRRRVGGAFPKRSRRTTCSGAGTSAITASSRSTARPPRTSTTRWRWSARPTASAWACTSRTSRTTSRREPPWTTRRSRAGRRSTSRGACCRCSRSVSPTASAR